jgi:hypothetical protein
LGRFCQETPEFTEQETWKNWNSLPASRQQEFEDLAVSQIKLSMCKQLLGCPLL